MLMSFFFEENADYMQKSHPAGAMYHHRRLGDDIAERFNSRDKV